MITKNTAKEKIETSPLKQQTTEENPCKGCNDPDWCATGNPCGGKQ